MSQKLTLPIDDMEITAGYKSAKYRQEWGFGHYGIDAVDAGRANRKLRSLGDGKVVACGRDGATDKDRLGNCIVLVYSDVQLSDGRAMGLACRMFHLAKINCKAGDIVTAGTLLGEYGNTGAHSSGAHLHIEFDSDTKYPAYAYGIAANGNVIKRGTADSTLDPCKVLWLGEGQSVKTNPQWITEGWVSKDSINLPSVPVNDGSKQDIAKLRARIDELECEKKVLVDNNAVLTEKIVAAKAALA